MAQKCSVLRGECRPGTVQPAPFARPMIAKSKLPRGSTGGHAPAAWDDYKIWGSCAREASGLFCCKSLWDSHGGL